MVFKVQSLAKISREVLISVIIGHCEKFDKIVMVIVATRKVIIIDFLCRNLKL